MDSAERENPTDGPYLIQVPVHVRNLAVDSCGSTGETGRRLRATRRATQEVRPTAGLDEGTGGLSPQLPVPSTGRARCHRRSAA